MKTLNLAYRIVVFTVALLFVQVLSGTRSVGTADAGGAALNRLIKAAVAEGELNMLGSGIDEQKAWVKWEKAMNAKYGININLTFTRGPSQGRMASRLRNELKAGKPATTDIFIGGVNQILSFPAGTLENVNWTEISPAIPPEAVTPDNAAVAISSRMPGITYNTRIISKKEVPRTLDDLLDPKWKGKIASTPYAAGFPGAALIVGYERMGKFLKELSRENLAGLLRCSELERIISGEFAILALDCGRREIDQLKAKGAPIEHKILKDIPIITHWYLGVPENSPHPNMAKLFTVFMLTQEAQKILWESKYQDLHYLKGTNMFRQVQSLRSEGIEVRAVGVRELTGVLKTHKMQRRKYQKILRGK